MTNKEKYISSFSGVEPSDEIKERILTMTSAKKRTSLRAVAVAFAVLMLLAAAMLTANAATDGELVEKFIVLVNGQEISSGDYELKEELVTDENGNTQNRLLFSYNGETEDGDLIVITGDTENAIDDFEVNIQTVDEDETVTYQIINE